jgi:hypothetical protein
LLWVNHVMLSLTMIKLYNTHFYKASINFIIESRGYRPQVFCNDFNKLQSQKCECCKLG